jgi:SPP1 gp7 family putative phage head morphogenesis protein
MNTPDQLIEQAARHAAHLERLKAGEVKKIRVLLRDAEEKLVARLARQRVTSWSRARAEVQIETLRDLLANAYRKDILPALKSSVSALGAYEAGFEVRSLANVISANFETPTPTQVSAAIRLRPLSINGPDKGKVLDQFVKDWSATEITRATGAIRSGFVNGDTTEQILSTLRDDIFPVTSRAVQGFTRTALQHAAVTAREETWNQNKDIVTGVTIVATLDGKTSAICRTLDGNEYPLNSGPRPPFHPSCRTTTAAALSEKFAFLDQDATRRARDPETGRVKYVNADLKYYGWLKKQPALTQDSIIGRTRGKLLRDGGLSSERFSALQLNKNFKPTSLEEMRKLEPAAFAKANLNKKAA